MINHWHKLQGRLLLVFISALLLANFSGCKPQPGEKPTAENVVANEVTEAAGLLKQVEADPSNAELRNKLALAYLKEDNINNALHHINKALEVAPSSADNLITLSEIYLMMGDPHRAQLTLFRAMDLNPRHAGVYMHLGRLQVITKDYRLAFEYLRRAIEIEPNYGRALYWKGFAHLENGDTVRAIENMQLAVAADPAFFEGFFKLGNLMIGRNNHLAEEYLTRALELSPESQELRLSIAVALQDAGQHGKAAKIYREIMQYHPDNYKAWYNLGYLHLVVFENADSAIICFTRAIELQPELADAWYNRGIANELKGDFSSARKDYTQALTINVNDPLTIKALNRIDGLQ